MDNNKIAIDSSGKIDFEHGLAREFWSLDEFVCYVTHSNNFTSDSRLYKLAHKDILDGKLSPENPPHDGYSDDNNYFLSPRQWIDWVFENYKYLICKELLKYLDYTYWIEEKVPHYGGYTFDEFVTLVSSKQCPFPNEIRNTFDNEDTYELAKKVQLYFDENKISNTYIDLDEVPNCLSELNVKYPNELNRISEAITKLWEEQDKKRELEREDWKKDFIQTINLPHCELINAITLLDKSSLSTFNKSYRSFGFGFCSGFSSDSMIDFIKRAIKIGALPIEVEGSNKDKSDSIIKPKVFFKWCLDEKVPLDDEVREFIEKNLDLNSNLDALEAEDDNDISDIFSKVPQARANNIKIIHQAVKEILVEKFPNKDELIEHMKNKVKDDSEHYPFLKHSQLLRKDKGFAYKQNDKSIKKMDCKTITKRLSEIKNKLDG